MISSELSIVDISEDNAYSLDSGITSSQVLIILVAVILLVYSIYSYSYIDKN